MIPGAGRGHVDDLGHVALHHDVVPLWRDAGGGKQVLHVREVHRPTVEVVVRVVVVLSLFDAPFDRDLGDAADVLRAGGGDDLRAVESPVLVGQDHRHRRLVRTVRGFAAVVAGVVDQVRELLGSDPAGTR